MPAVKAVEPAEDLEDVDWSELDDREIPDEEVVEEYHLKFIQDEFNYQRDKHVNFGKPY